MEFQPLKTTDQALLKKYFESRDILSCEYCFATLVLWNNRYNITYHMEENYVLFMEEYDGVQYAIMPLCHEVYFDEAFTALKAHFKSLGLPLLIYVADEVFKNYIEANFPNEYEITTNRDEYDYLYDAHALRTLEGKKLRKKRNHVNGFLRDYEGRWEYKEIHTNEDKMICSFMYEWAIKKGESDEMLQQEMEGVCALLANLDNIDVIVGGIFIDEKLEAFTLGSVVNDGKEVLVHIEKADPDIRGLYQMINQQFLINSVPDVSIVNREDDVGIEGLRKAKMSYYPSGFAKKFTIKER